jgi:Leucine-rich repeat (LRR) protein
MLARNLKRLALSMVLATAAAPVLGGPFPDKNLDKAVRAQVFEKRDNDQELTEDDLRKVFEVKGNGMGITDLAGLEKCTNLLLVDLARNEISDVSPLKELTGLQSLNLSGNKISDITPLAGLTALQHVELEDNQIDNVEPLKGMAKLASLYLSGNKITDCTPIGELKKLASLDLSRNLLKSAAPLETLERLGVLTLSDNEIDDLAPLCKHPPRSMLIVERNKITDLAPLVEAAKADQAGEKRFAPFLRLYVADNPLADASQLDALKEAGVHIMESTRKEKAAESGGSAR